MANTEIVVTQAGGNWVSDGGVAYANGTPLVRVKGNPVSGQYALGPNPGDYIFSTADKDAAIVITYGFVPGDLEAACLQMVVARFQNKGRNPYLKSQDEPGLGSQTWWVGDLPGKGDSAFPPEIMAVLDRYRELVVA